MKRSVLIFVTCILAIAVVGLIIAVPVFLPRDMHQKALDAIPCSQQHLPYYVINGTLYKENALVDVSALCKKYNEQFSLKDVLCISNKVAYSVCSIPTEGGVNWVVVSVDIENKVVNEACTLFDARIVYWHDHVSQYSERNGYYHDGKIVLNDFVTVLVYDLETGNISQYDYEGFSFPPRLVYGQCIDSQTVQLHQGDTIETFTLQDMAENDEGISKLYAMKSRKTWGKTGYLDGFFSESSVQVADEHIYAVGSCLNFSGESYGVILIFEQQSRVWEYGTARFSGDSAHRSCYVVPEDR